MRRRGREPPSPRARAPWILAFALLTVPALAAIAGAQSPSAAPTSCQDPKTPDRTSTDVNETLQFPYTCEAIAYDPLNLTWTELDLEDDTTQVLSIPFSFAYNGTGYGQVNVSSNGFLSFTSSDAGCCEGQSLGNARSDAPDAVIAAYWEDLQPNPPWVTVNTAWSGLVKGTVQRQCDQLFSGIIPCPINQQIDDTFEQDTFGPNPKVGYNHTEVKGVDVTVIRFHNVTHFADVPAPTEEGRTALRMANQRTVHNVTFQIQLWANGTIEVHYEQAISDGGFHAAGLENAAGDLGLVYQQGKFDLDHTAVRYTYFG